MSATNIVSLLCQRGVLLFLLGLLSGFAQGFCRNPRAALSAHLTATQAGVALVAFGVMWPHLALAPAWAMPIAQMLWISFYVLWFAFLLAALFGASRVIPIAGQGHRAAAWQEMTVSVLMISGSLASLVSVGAIVLQWSWKA